MGQALAAATAGTELPLDDARRRDRRLDPLFALRPEHGSVEIGWTWLHLSAWGTGTNVDAKLLQLGGRIRGVGLLAGRAEDRRPQRTVTPGARGDRGVTRGRSPRARAGRGEPRQRVVQRHRRRVAGRSRAARDAAGGQVGRPGYTAAARIRDAELERGRSKPSRSSAPAAASTGGERAARRARPRLDGVDPGARAACVPDRSIADVAQTIPAGPWVAHGSGATASSARSPCTRGASGCTRCSRSRRPATGTARRRLGGVTAEGLDALGVATWLAETLGLRPFESTRAVRPITPGRRSRRTTS